MLFRSCIALIERPAALGINKALSECDAKTRGDGTIHSAVEIEEMQEDGELTRIGAVILVDRPTHKGILIGAGGARLKAIGTDARLEIEKLLDKKVFLRLFVKVEQDWTRDAIKVRRLTRELT